MWAVVLFAQDITGDWYALIEAPGTQLRLVLHITEKDGQLEATLDSPDQKAMGMAVASISFEDGKLDFTMKDVPASYTGQYKDGEFTGTWKQGAVLPLNFQREEIAKKVVSRPQEPKTPYPYPTEDVTFPNEEAGIKLAGTLTLPQGEGPFPAVILISGSGPQDRNEELFGHKPFLVIADYLTRRGIAVLRYDDRGTAESEGAHGTATTQDFATDAYSAVKYLATRNEIDEKHIGLMGHSEGGIIAPIVAAKSEKVSYIVLLAGTGIPGDELLALQTKLIMEAQGVPPLMLARSSEINKGAIAIVKNAQEGDDLKAKLTEYILEQVPEAFRPANMTEQEFADSQTAALRSPWMQYFLRYDPSIILEEVDCPVLAVNGDKDLQVPAKVNLEGIAAALKKGGNQQVTIIEFPDLNHLFQKTTTGLPSEYGDLEETFSEEVMQKVTEWIKEVTQ